MENNSQNRKHPTKNVRITKFSAEKDDSYKVQVSIKLVPLTKERIAFACTGHENEQKNRKRKRLISAEKEQQVCAESFWFDLPYKLYGINWMVS